MLYTYLAFGLCMYNIHVYKAYLKTLSYSTLQVYNAYPSSLDNKNSILNLLWQIINFKHYLLKLFQNTSYSPSEKYCIHFEQVTDLNVYIRYCIHFEQYFQSYGPCLSEYFMFRHESRHCVSPVTTASSHPKIQMISYLYVCHILILYNYNNNKAHHLSAY